MKSSYESTVKYSDCLTKKPKLNIMCSKSCHTWTESRAILGVFLSAKDVSRGRLSAHVWNEEQVNSAVWIAHSFAPMFRPKNVVLYIVSPSQGRGFDAPLSKRRITGKRARTFS